MVAKVCMNGYECMNGHLWDRGTEALGVCTGIQFASDVAISIQQYREFKIMAGSGVTLNYLNSRVWVPGTAAAG